jgi:hypothetical protein
LRQYADAVIRRLQSGRWAALNKTRTATSTASFSRDFNEQKRYMELPMFDMAFTLLSSLPRDVITMPNIGFLITKALASTIETTSGCCTSRTGHETCRPIGVVQSKSFSSNKATNEQSFAQKAGMTHEHVTKREKPAFVGDERSRCTVTNAKSAAADGLEAGKQCS